MIALLGLFEHYEIFVEHFLLRKCDTVNAGQLVACGIASPKCTRHTGYFDGFDGARRHQVRTATEVGKRALCVGRNRTVFEVKVDMLAFIFLSVFFKLFQGISFRYFAAHDRLVSPRQLVHFFFNLRKIVLADGRTIFGHHVVKEAVLHSRTKTKLNAGIQLL